MGHRKKQQRRHRKVPAFASGSGGGIRTPDLWVMSPTSCRCSTPRRVRGRRAIVLSAPGRLAVWPASRLADSVREWGVPAAASPPVGSPPQYSPALRWVTTGFGMGPGGASTLSATGTPHPRYAGGRDPCCATLAAPLLAGRPRALHEFYATHTQQPRPAAGLLSHTWSGNAPGGSQQPF